MTATERTTAHPNPAREDSHVAFFSGVLPARAELRAAPVTPAHNAGMRMIQH
jgi:hypothetical protein